MSLPCHELTFAKGIDPPDDGDPIMFEAGTSTPLRRSPGDDTLATISPPPAVAGAPPDFVIAYVIARHGDWVEVRIARPIAHVAATRCSMTGPTDAGWLAQPAATTSQLRIRRIMFGMRATRRALSGE